MEIIICAVNLPYKKILLYISSSLLTSTHENFLHSAHGAIIRDLCLARDIYYQSTNLFSHAEIIMLIECLCTT